MFSTTPDAKSCVELADKEFSHMEDHILSKHQLHTTGEDLQHLRWYSVLLCVAASLFPEVFLKSLISQALGKDAIMMASLKLNASRQHKRDHRNSKDSQEGFCCNGQSN